MLFRSNRSFRLRARGRDYVLRVPGPGTERFISRAAEAANLAAAVAAGVAPPLVRSYASGVQLSVFVDESRALAPEDLRQPAVLAEVAFLLRRLHECEAAFQGAIEPLAVVDRYLALAPHPELARLRRAVEASTAPTPAEERRPCHGDPVAANLLASPRGIVLIDWEYSCMAEPAWDLAVLALDAELGPTHERLLLAAYGRPELVERVEAAKPLVRLVSAAWANAALAAGSTAPRLSALVAAAGT